MAGSDQGGMSGTQPGPRSGAGIRQMQLSKCS